MNQREKMAIATYNRSYMMWDYPQADVFNEIPEELQEGYLADADTILASLEGPVIIPVKPRSCAGANETILVRAMPFCKFVDVDECPGPAPDGYEYKLVLVPKKG